MRKNRRAVNYSREMRRTMARSRGNFYSLHHYGLIIECHSLFSFVDGYRIALEREILLFRYLAFVLCRIKSLSKDLLSLAFRAGENCFIIVNVCLRCLCNRQRSNYVTLILHDKREGLVCKLISVTSRAFAV